MREVTSRLIVWLLIAGVGLSIPLLDLRLWARQREIQPLSLAIVMTGFILALSFAGPWLARSWDDALSLVSGSLPMLLLATILSDQHFTRGILCWAITCLAIVITRLLCRFRGWSLIAPTVVLLPIALAYVARDFSSTSPAAMVRFSPLHWCIVVATP